MTGLPPCSTGTLNIRLVYAVVDPAAGLLRGKGRMQKVTHMYVLMPKPGQEGRKGFGEKTEKP